MSSISKLSDRHRKFRDKVFLMLVRLLGSANDKGGYDEVLRYRKILLNEVLIKHFMCSEDEANALLDMALKELDLQNTNTN